VNYQKVYNAIVENRQRNLPSGYVEKHHILPKSLGGDDSPQNIVKLTAREHFICHLLLTKIHQNNHLTYFKMVKAFMMMLRCKSNNQSRQFSSRCYEKLKKDFSLAQSLSQTGRLNSQFGKPKSAETREKIRQTILNQKKKRAYLNEGKSPAIDSQKQKVSNKSSFREARRLERKLKKEQDIELYRSYYQIYALVGFDEFVKQTGYNKTKQNLVQRFCSLLPEFEPQNGKRRRLTQSVQKEQKFEYDKNINKKNTNSLKGHEGYFKGKNHTEETKTAIGKNSSVHQKGSGNSQYNTRWVFR
jgi:hypothetical protein